MDLHIRQALPDDLAAIAVIEQQIEHESPADLTVLEARLTMFKEGFLTAWHDGRLIGYAESCLWNEDRPKFCSEKEFFAKKHTAQGKTLYIIFIGVCPQYQRRGIGTRLIQSLQQVAKAGGQKRVHAVTWYRLENLYIKQGFVAVSKIPAFLPEGDFTLLEYAV